MRPIVPFKLPAPGLIPQPASPPLNPQVDEPEYVLGGLSDLLFTLVTR